MNPSLASAAQVDGPSAGSTRCSNPAFAANVGPLAGRRVRITVDLPGVQPRPFRSSSPFNAAARRHERESHGAARSGRWLARPRKSAPAHATASHGTVGRVTTGSRQTRSTRHPPRRRSTDAIRRSSQSRARARRTLPSDVSGWRSRRSPAPGHVTASRSTVRRGPVRPVQAGRRLRRARGRGRPRRNTPRTARHRPVEHRWRRTERDPSNSCVAPAVRPARVRPRPPGPVARATAIAAGARRRAD